MHVDALRVAREPLGERGREAAPTWTRRTADDDLGEILAPRVAEDFRGLIAALQPFDLGAEAQRQPQRLVGAGGFLGAEDADMGGAPIGVERGRKPARRAYHVERALVGADAD